MKRRSTIQELNRPYFFFLPIMSRLHPSAVRTLRWDPLDVEVFSLGFCSIIFFVGAFFMGFLTGGAFFTGFVVNLLSRRLIIDRVPLTSTLKGFSTFVKKIF